MNETGVSSDGLMIKHQHSKDMNVMEGKSKELKTVAVCANIDGSDKM